MGVIEVLSELHIKDYVLIEERTISFGEGLNVITGETGAGKSLIMDCINLALGGKASLDMVRSGCNSAFIEAIFEGTHGTDLIGVLDEVGISPSDDGILILSREISVNGRNRCRINGQTVTCNVLSQVGECLVNIYGQHEHQVLARPSSHLSILDGFGGHDVTEAAERYMVEFKRWSDISRELKAMRAEEEENRRQQDFLSFECEEIESAAITEGEDVALEDEKNRLSNWERVSNELRRTYGLIYEAGSGDFMPAVDLVSEATKSIDVAVKYDSSLSPVHMLMSSALEELTEASSLISKYLDDMDFDPSRLDEVEERLALVSRLKRKYGGSISDVIAFAAECKDKLERIENFEKRSDDLERQYRLSSLELLKLADVLTYARKTTASKLEDAVVKELKELCMTSVQFKVEMRSLSGGQEVVIGDETVRVASNGKDDVEFTFSANVGEPLRPLAKIASGGELSRIMLGIKAALAASNVIPTMIFDEVDQGVGGRTANAVADKLTKISHGRQSIVVTHLAQIACVADHHLNVVKNSDENKTTVEVRTLGYEDRVGEIARMLGGEELTSLTLQTAREMLRRHEVEQVQLKLM